MQNAKGRTWESYGPITYPQYYRGFRSKNSLVYDTESAKQRAEKIIEEFAKLGSEIEVEYHEIVLTTEFPLDEYYQDQSWRKIIVLEKKRMIGTQYFFNKLNGEYDEVHKSRYVCRPVVTEY